MLIRRTRAVVPLLAGLEGCLSPRLLQNGVASDRMANRNMIIKRLINASLRNLLLSCKRDGRIFWMLYIFPSRFCHVSGVTQSSITTTNTNRQNATSLQSKQGREAKYRKYPVCRIGGYLTAYLCKREVRKHQAQICCIVVLLVNTEPFVNRGGNSPVHVAAAPQLVLLIATCGRCRRPTCMEL